MNNIISLSGGKDSTAMLLMMIERKEPIHSIVFFDTGWEFPQMLDHINLLEKRIGINIIKLHPPVSFEYLLLKKPIIRKKKGSDDHGKIFRLGHGWPTPKRRWCTYFKTRTVAWYLRDLYNNNCIVSIGYAADELNRTEHFKDAHKYLKRYPLIEYGITEANALEYCYSKGFDWEGLYKLFGRVSCYCCPLQRIGELKKLRKHFPNLWRQMLKMDKAILVNKGFRDYDTIHDLEKRFAKEDQIEKRIINFLL